MPSVSGKLGVSLAEITGYITSVLTNSLDSVLVIDLASSSAQQVSTLLTRALELPGTRYLSARYDTKASVPRDAMYTDRVLQDAARIRRTSKYTLKYILPDLLYYEMWVVLELVGPSGLDRWDLHRAVGVLPLDISSKFFDLRGELQEILCDLHPYTFNVGSRDLLSAASTNRDSRYIKLMASLMDPKLYGPAAPAEPALWVRDSMHCDNTRSVSRICALSRQFLDPHTLLISTLGCTSIVIEEAMRNPKKYNVCEVLDDGAFDEYARASLVTISHVGGNPLTANLRGLLSMHPREAIVAQLERYMRMSLWYMPIWKIPCGSGWARTMVLQCLLELCAPYELYIVPYHNLFLHDIHTPSWEILSTVYLKEENFYANLMKIGPVRGITLCLAAKKYLAAHVLRILSAPPSSDMEDQEWEQYAARYVSIAGPADPEWLSGVMRSVRSLCNSCVIPIAKCFLNIMTGNTSADAEF